MHLRTVLCFCLLTAPAALHAESKNPADYPLRVHIFARSETTFYSHRMAEESKGEGRGNVFENGEPRAVDFSFACSDKLKASFGYETYPAKWKKPGQELTVLLPVFGKANSYWTCNLKTALKDDAYMMHDGRMASEPASAFKAWMAKHDYDPEHGKNTPIRTERPGGAASAQASPTGASPGQAAQQPGSAPQ